ncbi:MAG: glycosyltransferase family 2 protein [Paracoccaceae bacterium]
MTKELPQVAVDICICTFRRPHLAQTLDSLGQLEVMDGVELRVIVADNDETPSARGVAEGFRKTSPLPLLYVHCPAGNISIARNACLDHCTGDYVAFIDDDEVATPNWLRHLLGVAQTEDADVVLGPVDAHYRPDAPAWLRAGDFHSTRPVWVRGRIRSGYTCNVLFRRDAVSLRRRRFDLALGQSGGEDTDFFHRAYLAGARFAFAPGALLTEEVPDQRAKLGWLFRRRFRMGQTHGGLVRRDGGLAGWLAGLFPATLKVCYCLGAALIAVADPARRNAALLRGTLHAGTVSGLLGQRALRQYGTGRSTPAKLAHAAAKGSETSS